MFLRSLITTAMLGGLLAAQDVAPDAAVTPQPAPSKPELFVVAQGTKVPLSLINTISTKHSAVGDQVYLETSFPILASGRIVIPVGSYVSGTVTQLKRPGRAKGRGELYVRFDTLTLPNGVTRDFRARIGGLDGDAAGELDKSEGTVRSEGNKAGDARTIGETTAAGASIGGIAGSAAGHAIEGVGIGAAAGAAVGLITILSMRGPDAVLAKGSSVEMVLDRSISFSAAELDFGNYTPPRTSAASTSAPKSGQQAVPPMIRRFPW